MPKIKQTDTHFNHVPACLILVFIQFLFALPLLYQCKYTLKYNEEAQQDCCYNVGPGADQFSIGFNQSRNRTIDQYTKQRTKYVSYTTGKKCTTDDCGGNSVHFKAGCLGGGTCHGIQAVADSADGSKETGKNICLHLCFLNIKSHQGCRLLIAAHCEDQETIKNNIAKYKEMFAGENDIPIGKHPYIRSSAACYASSELAVRLARIAGARLHILHVSTAKELQLFNDYSLSEKHITAEACVAHLLFTLSDYRTLGTRIKCNPAIKKQADRDALRAAVNSGLIDVIATDHAPHLLSEKEGGALKAMSGMPMIQFSLVSMLQLVDEGVFTLETIVEKMCHAPAQIYRINERGYIREGYRADLVLVRPDAPWEVTADKVLSKCGWSPLEGHTFNWKVERTFANGHPVYSDGMVDDAYRGEELRFGE